MNAGMRTVVRQTDRDGGTGVGVARSGVALAMVALMALALTGCETTAEKSAKLEKLEAKHTTPAQKGLSIARASTQVEVLGATVVRDSEGAAAAITVRNTTAHTLRSAPIAITVKNASGQTVFQNNAPGLEAALTSIPSLPAHGSVTWVDDQIPSAGAPVSVSAIVGEASIVSGTEAEPRIEIEGPRVGEASSGEAAPGTVRNRSKIAQRSLVVFAVARRAGTIVAAGRALLPEVAAGASTPFQMFFIGNPSASGTQIETSAPATVLG